MVERAYPENYLQQNLQETPYVIPMAVWILLGLAIVSMLIVSIYAISKAR
jgi:hypothetical protein